MINSVGQSISSVIGANSLRESGKARTGAAVASGSTVSGSAPSTPASRMAAEGAPVDLDRISAIKAAIASGNYPVDPDAIAERMIALDLEG